ncbi:glutamate--tRNA ligase [Paenibacillus sp. KN14-4R]|uniref:glutamate--tRNA ligase n=1 Tax=Paenibacillus sp. KN14-4R TaxID=3445773 RepID=UPI003F9FD0F2
MTKPVRVRYAPSPTGLLHIGGARTALFNYLLARKNNGSFIVRFEDTDQTRHLESGIDSQLNGLRWLGINWDESVDIGGPYGPYRQMERLDIYRPYVEQLKQDGHAYPCYCTESDLEKERAEQEERGETPMYSGRCRNLTADQRAQFEAEGRKPSIRFRVPQDRIIKFVDKVRGEVEFDTNGIGDFIIMRPDGIPTYNFVVVIDDFMMKMSTVIRAEEHLTNTPRQIMIYEALGQELPEFAHLSLILNPNRKKMSKRDANLIQFIEQYQELGYMPEAVVNFIVLIGWSPVGEEEFFTIEELIEQFDLDRVAKSPAVFDMDKLNWMNNHYIKKAPIERVVELALPHLQKEGRLPAELDDATRDWAVKLIALYQEQLRFGADIVNLSEMFFSEEFTMEDEGVTVMQEEQVPAVLRSFLAQVEASESFAAEDIQPLIKKVQAETGTKGKGLFMPIRVALTGQVHGRDLNMTIHLLGKEKVIARLQKALA